MGEAVILERRETRRDVEMLARIRRDTSTTTVMLKDLTRDGTRIEGIGGLVRDEAVSLGLPGMRPLLAFVALSNGHGAGLEFAEPLRSGTFEELVGTYGLNTGGMRMAA
jgi:hypothetical protein